MRVPACARMRSWSCPASTRGKISVPSPRRRDETMTDATRPGSRPRRHHGSADNASNRPARRPLARTAPEPPVVAPRGVVLAASSRPTAPAPAWSTAGRTRSWRSRRPATAARTAPAPTPCHEERRDEHREDAEHRPGAAGRRSSAVPPVAAGRSGQPRAMWVWMFSISTVASSTSTPTASARPPSVMMLIVWPVSPEPDHARQQRDRDVSITTMNALRQSRRNSRTIRPVRSAPARPFEQQALDRPGDVRRLVELDADLDVVGHDRLHSAGCALTCVRPRSASRRRPAW